MSEERVELLVVGLGPAGSRAAEAAARAGLAVVALDRKAVPGVPVQCAEFVPAMLDHELAGLDAVTVQRISRMLTHVEGEPADETPDFKGRMLDRAAFDRVLVSLARAAGAECRFGTAIRAIAGDGAVRLGDGSVLRPRVLIGADGARSAVGRAIASVNRALVETRQLTVPLPLPHDATEVFLRAEFEGGYGWLFPRGVRANLGLGVTPASRRRLEPLLDRLHAELAAPGRVGHTALAVTGGAIPVGGRVCPYGGLGPTAVLLAGDAAGLANPVTGAGIAAAVQSGALAGTAASAWLGGDRGALADYDDELDALFRASLGRALARRAELAALRKPPAAALKRGWIAYPEYWAA